jgi:hypothetical protein
MEDFEGLIKFSEFTEDGGAGNEESCSWLVWLFREQQQLIIVVKGFNELIEVPAGRGAEAECVGSLGLEFKHFLGLFEGLRVAFVFEREGGLQHESRSGE